MPWRTLSRLVNRRPSTSLGVLTSGAAKECQRRGPGLLGGFEVRSVSAGLLAQESVAGAFEDVVRKALPQFLQLRFRRRNSRIHPRVVAAKETKQGSVDTRNRRGIGRAVP